MGSTLRSVARALLFAALLAIPLPAAAQWWPSSWAPTETSTGLLGGGTVSLVDCVTSPNANLLSCAVLNPTTTPQVVITWPSQTGNCVIAAPADGSTASPTCRSIVALDLVSSFLNAVDVTSPDDDDIFMINAIAGSQLNKRATLHNAVKSVTSSATALTLGQTDPTTDVVALYDDSATDLKKTTPNVLVQDSLNNLVGTVPNTAFPWGKKVASLTTSTTQLCNDASDQTALTWTVPANALGTTGTIHWWVQGNFVIPASVARSLVYKVTLGGTTLFADSCCTSPAAAGTYRVYFTGDLIEHGTTSSQWVNVTAIEAAADAAATGFGDFGSAAATAMRNAGGTGAKDDTGSLVLNIVFANSAAVSGVCMQMDAGAMIYYP